MLECNNTFGLMEVICECVVCFEVTYNLLQCYETP
jgi:hypothetical protein